MAGGSAPVNVTSDESSFKCMGIQYQLQRTQEGKPFFNWDNYTGIDAVQGTVQYATKACLVPQSNAANPNVSVLYVPCAQVEPDRIEWVVKDNPNYGTIIWQRGAQAGDAELKRLFADLDGDNDGVHVAMVS